MLIAESELLIVLTTLSTYDSTVSALITFILHSPPQQRPMDHNRQIFFNRLVVSISSMRILLCFLLYCWRMKFGRSS